MSPMLVTLGKPPLQFADFAVEAKYDGQCGLAVVDGGAVTLFSRNGADITRTFPEIAAAIPAAPSRRFCGPSALETAERRNVRSIECHDLAIQHHIAVAYCFVIGRWLPGVGPNSRTVGALVVGSVEILRNSGRRPVRRRTTAAYRSFETVGAQHITIHGRSLRHRSVREVGRYRAGRRRRVPRVQLHA